MNQSIGRRRRKRGYFTYLIDMGGERGKIRRGGGGGKKREDILALAGGFF